MRRPVKPFVTEYKGPNRRPGPTSPPTRAKGDESPQPQHSPSEVFSRGDGFSRGGDAFSRGGESFSRGDASRSSDLSRNSEDSYEAALRAADALFAPSPSRSEPRPSVIVPHDPAEEQPDGADPTADGEQSPRGGGRILRAIDEPETPGLADLEVERTPKRRGRKPGSKNKPKVPLVAAQPIPAAVSMPAYVSMPEVASMPVAEHRPWSDPPTQAAAHAAASVIANAKAPETSPVAIVETPAAASRAAVASYAARQNERFGWVRTKLAPGEQWKRRLPKVCW